MTNALQDAINATPAGGVLDLKGDTYSVGEDPLSKYALVFQKPITVVGAGATIEVVRSTLRNRATVMTRAQGVKLLGDVTIHADPVDVGNPDFEAQHAIQLEGATDFTTTWTVVNPAANAHYWTRNAKTGQPCKNITVHDAHTSNVGRQHYALQCVDGFSILRPTMVKCARGHSYVTFEPNGHLDMCKNGSISHGMFDGTDGAGWCFSSAAMGPQSNDCLSHVTLYDLYARNQGFGITIGSPAGIRKGPFVSVACRSKTITHRPTVVISAVDTLWVVQYAQPSDSNVDVFNINDCTGVVTSRV